MNIVKQTNSKNDFEKHFLNEIVKFRGHRERIKQQFTVQRTLKENLEQNHVYIHMDFAEDYRCRSQEEIQSTVRARHRSLLILWLPTIRKVISWFIDHQSYVFVSDETLRDARFVFALITKLVPTLLELVPCLKFIHYWIDSPTSQYRNKTIFKIVSCHQEYFIVLASWSYMKSGHGKGSCDPICGTAKRKADIAVKNDKVVIQDAHEFFAWVKKTEEASAIRFNFLSSEDYVNAAFFFTEACKDIKPGQDTMKLHAVRLHAAKKIWVRDTSCFGDFCFKGSFQQDTSCES